MIELEPAKRPIPDPDMYLPKFPLPRDCFDKIDAAFTFGPTLYLISNTFIWEYQKEGAGYQMIGGPQGVSNVLSGWNHITRAAFTGWFRDPEYHCLSDSAIGSDFKFHSQYLTLFVSLTLLID